MLGFPETDGPSISFPKTAIIDNLTLDGTIRGAQTFPESSRSTPYPAIECLLAKLSTSLKCRDFSAKIEGLSPFDGMEFRISAWVATTMMIQLADEQTSRRQGSLTWPLHHGELPDMAKSKILVVEDESSLVGVLSYNLQREGYEVVVAKEGREALRKAQMILPDLILLDLMLPGISGLEICRELRASPRTANLPIL